MAKRFPPKTRLVALCLLVVALAVAWAANALHVRSLEKELYKLGTEHTAALRRDGTILVGEEFVAEATAAKRFALFGPTSGKVTVYLRSRGERGNTRYRVLMIFYEKSGAGWRQTESAMCSDTECKPLAKKAFHETV